MSCRLPSSLCAACRRLPAHWLALLAARRSPCAVAQSLDHEHGLAAPVTRLPPPASSPGVLPGVLPARAVRELILGRASRLDAFSGYRCPTWLPSSAVAHNWHTSGRSIPVLSY